MTTPEHKAPTDRLNYTGDLMPIVYDVCQVYELGMLRDFSVIEVGYEDCNVIINTEHGRFLAKMFAKFRTPEDIQRYVDIIQNAIEAGVHHPELIMAPGGKPTYTSEDITLTLLKFVEGETFYSLKRPLTDDERQAVIEQAVKINGIHYRPSYLFDSWAIPNIQSMFDRVKEFIASEDLALVEQAMKQYKSIPVDTLPHAFVHGDIIKTNTLKGDDGKVYILDFSVANWYPRIQELAVIVANLLHEEPGPSIEESCKLVIDQYSQLNPLTDDERRHLPAYALAGVAMEFMGAYQEKFINGVDGEENDYWLKLGREGLRRALLRKDLL